MFVIHINAYNQLVPVQPLYLCRRWQDNTDASLSLEKKNQYNTYKDWLRTMEVKRRQALK